MTKLEEAIFQLVTSIVNLEKRYDDSHIEVAEWILSLFQKHQSNNPTKILEQIKRDLNKYANNPSTDKESRVVRHFSYLLLQDIKAMENGYED